MKVNRMDLGSGRFLALRLLPKVFGFLSNPANCVLRQTGAWAHGAGWVQTIKFSYVIWRAAGSTCLST